MEFIHKVTGQIIDEKLFRAINHKEGFTTYFPQVITPESIAETEFDIYIAPELEPCIPTQAEIIIQQIHELEAQITTRRIREAVLGTDNGWLADIDAQIAVLREQL